MTDTATHVLTDQGVPIGWSIIADRPEPRLCECGCLTALRGRKTARFAPGHNTFAPLGQRLAALLDAKPPACPEYPGALAIPLGGKLAAGRVALVDEEDLDLVAAHAWHVNFQRNHPRTSVYAITNIHTRRGGRRISGMHRMITGFAITDHINHDGLDNRRANLREATALDNSRNRRNRLGSSSQFKGVSWNKEGRNWAAYICIDGRQVALGRFSDEIAAARAYDEAARSAFGEFVCPNFPGGQLSEVTA